MFTGIVQSCGVLCDTQKCKVGRRISIDLNHLHHAKVRLGDSIAVNGVCLTAAEIVDNIVVFDVSRETLRHTLIGQWSIGKKVNLELALTLQTLLGGHLVSGHVDGMAKMVGKKLHSNTVEMSFEICHKIGKYIAAKGSVCLDGVSLTSNTVIDQGKTTKFSLMVVPHTLESTTLGELDEGNKVHLEIDLIARYLHRLIQTVELKK